MKFKNSVFLKYMLGFTLPIILISIIFSVVLFNTANFIVDKYVLTEFDSKLEMLSNEIMTELDYNAILSVDAGDDQEYKNIVEKLNKLRENYRLEDVYILSKTGGTEHIVASKDIDDRDVAYEFDNYIHTAFETKTLQLSNVYEDSYGVHKSSYKIIGDSEVVLGLDIDATFIQEIDSILKWLTILISLFGIILGLLMSYFIARKTVKPIKQALNYVNETANGNLTTPTFELKNQDEISQLAKGIFNMVEDLRTVISQVNTNAEHVASTSVQLAASMQQSSATMEEITSSIYEVAQNANNQSDIMNHASTSVTEIAKQLTDVAGFTKEVTENAKYTTTTAERGNHLIQGAMGQIAVTTTMIQDTSVIVNQVNDYTKEIGEIVTLIKSITEQTNLLALNASIEAARAGEHGKGFAVVAEEVRKLADQSQAAASDIQNRIETIKAESSRAANAMQNSYDNLEENTKTFELVGASFDEIYTSVNALSEKILAVQTATQSVTDGVSKISESVQEVNHSILSSNVNIQNVADATNEQSASIEEVTSSASSLSEMADRLRELLVRFKM